RLSPSLTTLTLGCALDGAQAFRLLRHLPHLTSLHLFGDFPIPPEDPGCTLRVFHHLKAIQASSEPSNSFLPHLLHLKISIESQSADDKDYEPFVDFVRSRWIPDSELATKLGVECLRSVEFLFLDRAKRLPEPLAEMESLKDAGLQVVLPTLYKSLNIVSESPVYVPDQWEINELLESPQDDEEDAFVVPSEGDEDIIDSFVTYDN
ncbi:hypothetical protein V5O48_019151, partial [Marasmius crinis-equi]